MGLVVVVAPGIAMALDDLTPPTAQDVVDAYLAAIDEGDVEAAVAMSQPDATVASTALLTNEVYASAVRVDVTCEPVEMIGDASAEAACSSDAGEAFGAEPRVTLALRHDEAGWHIERGLEVQTTTAWIDIRVVGVAGEPLPGDSTIGPVLVWLLPGTYPVDAAPLPGIDVSTTGAAAVSPGAGAGTIFGYADDPDLAAIATEDAERMLVECMEQARLGCPQVEPLAAGTSVESAYIGTAYPQGAVVIDGSLRVSVVVQRLDDGVQTAAYRLVLVSSPDDEPGSGFRLEPHPDDYA